MNSLKEDDMRHTQKNITFTDIAVYAVCHDNDRQAKT
jgi:hypothetical protein